MYGRGRTRARRSSVPESQRGIAWRAMREGRGIRVESVDQHPDVYLHLRPYVPVSHAMALPLRGETGPRGAIVAGKAHPGRPLHGVRPEHWQRCLPVRRLLLSSSATPAVDQQRLGVLEDRDRIRPRQPP